MRISGGTVKGRKIGAKKAFLGREGERLRPTPSKVREALFSILQTRIVGSTFLDLYAGTGGVGIEALSRGAEKTVFVEEDRLRAKIIDDLLTGLRLSDRSRVICRKAVDFVNEESSWGNTYDIIFLDPPYSSGELMKLLPLLGRGKLLEDEGIVVAEHFSKTVLPDKVQRLEVIKNYVYGDTTLTLYRLERRP